MAEPTIICPKCGKEIRLTESLAAPLIDATRKQYEQQLAVNSAEIAKREAAIASERAGLAKAQATIAEQVTAQSEARRSTIAAEEAKKARAALESDLTQKDRLVADLSQTIQQLNDKLNSAQTAEVEFRRKERALAEKIREADLVVEKRIAEMLGPEREKAKREADEEYRLKLLQEQKRSEDLLRQLDEAKRRAEQGSQQMQGEVQELDLERRLREAFTRDTVEPVHKGQFGGDAVHRVLGSQGDVCGTILWESKRTKNWSGGWPDKLKQDQRAAKADLAVIVTQTMPPGLDSFGEVEGVWVTTPALAMSLAAALRLTLTEAFTARRAMEGQQDKMAILYRYLTGPQFRQRVEAIKDAFMTMQEDLDAEKRVITKQWAKRQQQIERVMVSTVGMYGDLQAIAGKTLLEIDGMDLQMLGDGTAPPKV